MIILNYIIRINIFMILSAQKCRMFLSTVNCNKGPLNYLGFGKRIITD